VPAPHQVSVIYEIRDHNSPWTALDVVRVNLSGIDSCAEII
jgi:hypothetical protein